MFNFYYKHTNNKIHRNESRTRIRATGNGDQQQDRD